MFALNVADVSKGSSINSNINALRYGNGQLTTWYDRESDWHTENEDPFSERRDSNYDKKISLGTRFMESRSRASAWFVPSGREGHDGGQRPHHVGLLYALFLASASAGIMGLALSAAFTHGRTDAALLCVPFMTAFQILFARVTTDAGSALFGPLKEMVSTYEWYSLYHVLSFFTISRYLGVISEHETCYAAISSADALVIYAFMLMSTAIALYLLRRVDTP
jgi:hypothetical protein